MSINIYESFFALMVLLLKTRLYFRNRGIFLHLSIYKT